jgi:RimJ/RimL family protein N-acetyltransferase
MAGLPRVEALETDRLLLRRAQVDDAEVYRQLWLERDTRVPTHRRIDAHGRPTVADVAARIAAQEGEPGIGLLTAVQQNTGAVVGYCGLNRQAEGSPDEAELAYELLSAVHNRGYATEAGAAVVEGARTAGFRRLTAGVWDWNTASLRVLEKLGFHEASRGEPGSAHGLTLLMARDL